MLNCFNQRTTRLLSLFLILLFQAMVSGRLQAQTTQPAWKTGEAWTLEESYTPITRVQQAPAQALDYPFWSRHPDSFLRSLRIARDGRGDILPPGALQRYGTTRYRVGLGVRTAAISPDGSLIVARPAPNYQVHFFDGKTGAIKHLFNLKYFMHYLRFTPDNQALIGLTYSQQEKTGKICLIDLNTEKLKVLHEIPVSPLTKIRFSPDGKYMAINGSGQLYLYRTGDWTLLKSLKYPLYDFQFTADGRGIYLGFGTVDYFGYHDLTTHELKSFFQTEKKPENLKTTVPSILAFEVSPNAKRMVVSSKGQLLVYDISGDAPHLIQKWPMKKVDAPCVHWLNEDSFVARTGIQLLTYKLGQEKKLNSAYLPFYPGVHYMDANFSMAKNQVMVMSAIFSYRVATFQGEKLKGLEQLNDATTDPINVMHHPQRSEIITIDSKHLYIYDYATGKIKRKFRVPNEELYGTNSNALSKDGRTLTLNLLQSRLSIWNYGDDIHMIKEIETGYRHVSRTDFSHQNDLLIVGSPKGYMLYDLKRHIKMNDFKYPKGVYDIEFTRDGQYFAVCTYGEAHFYKTGPVEKLNTLKLKGNKPLYIEWISNHAFTVLNNEDYQVYSFPEMQLLVDHHFPMTRNTSPLLRQIDIHPSKRWQVFNWWVGFGVIEVATGQIVFSTRSGHYSMINQVSFMPDGNYMLSHGLGTDALLWSVNPKDYVRNGKAIFPEVPLDECWAALKQKDDGRLAYRAIWSLVNQPEKAVKLIEKKLAPLAKKDDPRSVEQLISMLDDDDFDVREQAMDALTLKGRPAFEAIKKLDPQNMSPEQIQRLKIIKRQVRQSEIIPHRHLEIPRAMAVLEWINNESSRKLIQQLSQSPNMMVSSQAKQSLRTMREYQRQQEEFNSATPQTQPVE